MITPRRSAPTAESMTPREYGLYLRSCGFTWESIQAMLELRFKRKFSMAELESWENKAPDDAGALDYDSIYGMFSD